MTALKWVPCNCVVFAITASIFSALIDHEIISTVILLPSAESRRVAVSYKQKYWLTAK